jgi:hypothetical protein
MVDTAVVTITLEQFKTAQEEYIERARAGERLMIQVDGSPDIELRVHGQYLDMAVVALLWRDLPSIDWDQFRRDIDSIIDPRLWPTDD